MNQEPPALPSTRLAGWWLVGAVFVLWPADHAIRIWNSHQDELLHEETGDDGIPTRIRGAPLWRQALEPILALTGVGLLLATRRVRPADMGLTLGRPRITLWWTLVPVAALLLLVAGALLLIPLLIRGLGMTGLLDLLVATDATVAYVPWRSVLWYCIFTPIYEEILYRGMAYPALATALGRERALLACGVVWMLLHLAYGWDAWRMPYYFVTGVLFTWMFARSGSLVPSFVLHAVGNLIAPVLMDYLLGKDPGLFRRLVAGL